MRLLFWRKPEAPAPTECTHLWSNWSEPEEIKVTVANYGGGASDWERVTQLRHCLHCNIYQRCIA